MRAGNGAQIGAARRQNRIGMIRFRYCTNGNGGNANLIADFVRERGLEQAAIDRQIAEVTEMLKGADSVGNEAEEEMGISTVGIAS